ncbi:MAG: SLATT domain-containing protein [Sphingobium sp.]|jgi:hypothetical protein|nr:SLATT domain-containing protein [Sphingobium sp.]MCP5399416.1 SLATT domain-containing protein [Sphingomonas sp.]
MDMDPGEKLLWDMKVTAGCRFIASARLLEKDKAANISIAIYSSIVVSTSLIALVFDLGPIFSKVVAVGALVASIIILVLSMKLFADRHAVEAEQMHRCALEINELRRNFEARGFEKPAMIARAVESYNSILQKYSINHSEADFRKYKLSHRWEFEDLRDLDEKSAKRRKNFESITSNLIDKLALGFGAAGLAAAISGLISSLIGL